MIGSHEGDRSNRERILMYASPGKLEVVETGAQWLESLIYASALIKVTLTRASFMAEADVRLVDKPE